MSEEAKKVRGQHALGDPERADEIPPPGYVVEIRKVAVPRADGRISPRTGRIRPGMGLKEELKMNTDEQVSHGKNMRLTRHVQIGAVSNRGTGITLVHLVCRGMITDQGGGIYLCRGENCGTIFQRDQIFPLP